MLLSIINEEDPPRTRKQRDSEDADSLFLTQHLESDNSETPQTIDFGEVVVDKKFARGQIVTVSQLLEGEDGRAETQNEVRAENSKTIVDSQT